jgi:hypothetical protein|nr:MAG TPA: hypothetical protein [Caudoviricetes sp.]
MNAKETMRLMMAFRLQEIYNTLESVAESVGDLGCESAEKGLRVAREGLEDAAAEFRIRELFSEGKDE